MTEAEWLTCDDPRRMLRHLGEADDRRLRLFSCAYARTAGCLDRFREICRKRFYDERGRPLPPLELGAAQAELLAVRKSPEGSRFRFRFDGLPPLDADGESTVSLGESVADGRVRRGWISFSRHAVYEVVDPRGGAAPDRRMSQLCRDEYDAVMAACDGSARAGAVATVASAKHEFIGVSNSPSMKGVNRSLRRRVVEQTQQLQADLLREIFGDPFQSIAFDRQRLDPALREIAKSIYDRRAYDELPILADALADAGFVPDEIVEHLGADRPHVRGCWALDEILGPMEHSPLLPRLGPGPRYGWLGMGQTQTMPNLVWPLR